MKRLIIIAKQLRHYRRFIQEQSINQNETIPLLTNQIGDEQQNNYLLKGLIGTRQLAILSIEETFPQLPLEFILRFQQYQHFLINEDQLNLYLQQIDLMTIDEVLFNLFLILEPQTPLYKKERFPKYSRFSPINYCRKYEKITDTILTEGRYNELFHEYCHSWHQWLYKNQLIKEWKIWPNENEGGLINARCV